MSESFVFLVFVEPSQLETPFPAPLDGTRLKPVYMSQALIITPVRPLPPLQCTCTQTHTHTTHRNQRSKLLPETKIILVSWLDFLSPW